LFRRLSMFVPDRRQALHGCVSMVWLLAELPKSLHMFGVGNLPSKEVPDRVVILKWLRASFGLVELGLR
jgi:hypothetical protein